ncbi:T9SS type B sorting domain-containing protein [Flavobacterium sp. RHBU_24]|uniref:T9SS type B sorting domain-containing protein n=1 Tax=Flavobacterium sp. RHBU_24 TaxID=3391185 RepID=UPI0039850D0F
MPLVSFAQKEANNWYFGLNAGIHFNDDGSVVPLAGGQMQTNEGCSSISDADGNLLFYTDGRTVWDRNHVVMPNGDYFNGTGLLGDPSSSQSAVIIPKKNNPNIYYIFTVDEPHHINAEFYPAQYTGTYIETNGAQTIPEADDGLNNGLNYSVVDLNVAGSTGTIGDVTTRNVHLLTYDPANLEEARYKCSEKITAVKNASGDGYWVITHFVDNFYAFEVTADGVNETPVVTQINPVIPLSGYRRNAIGCIKASPNGKFVAIAHQQAGGVTGEVGNGGTVYLYNFNRATGQLSNPVMVDNNMRPYGVEFSPQNQKLYVSYQENDTGLSKVKQYNLLADSIPSSGVEISTGNTSTTLQLGPNGKIYKAVVNGTALDVINFPEADGVACNYVNSAVALPAGTASIFGLPPFVTSLFYATIQKEGTCFGETTQFSLHVNGNYDSVVWNFGDGSANTTLQSPAHTYAASGAYTVVAGITYDGITEFITQDVNILPPPTAAVPALITECDPDDDGFTVFNLNSTRAAILGGQNPADFTVYYYASQQDADANSNPLNGIAYTNTSNPQTVYARVVHNTNTDCYTTVAFQIQAALAATLTATSFSICDDATDGSNTNGRATFNLTDITAALVTSAGYSVSWHATEANAQAGAPALPSNFYTNTTVVYALIKNLAYPSCTYIQPINLIVNPLPPNVLNAVLVQCDTGATPDGITQFNLHEADTQYTGTNTALSVFYYPTFADAENDTNGISALYTNSGSGDVVYAKVLNTLSGCYRVLPLALFVTTNVLPLAIIETCDYDGVEDGFALFNLAEAGYENGSQQVAYYPTETDALAETNEIPPLYTNTQVNSQTVYARIESSNNCLGIARIDLHVRALPDIEENSTGVVCLNTRDYITLEAGVYGGQYDYIWSTGATTPDIMVNEPGIYTLIVTDNTYPTHCQKTRTVIVTASNVAEITDVIVEDLRDNNTVNIVAIPLGGVNTEYLYSLDAPNGPWQESPLFENVAKGLHMVYVYDTQGCGIIREQIGVLAIPKFFSPNGDAANEYWTIPGLGAERYKGSKLYIYDRYGKLLFDVDPKTFGWDGTFNGRQMPSSDYWFVLTVNDGRTVKGHFSLIR